MAILVTGQSFENYLAQTPAAFHTGLSAMFPTVFFGQGYPDFDPNLRQYPQIKQHFFGDQHPEVLFIYNNHATSRKELTKSLHGYEDAPGIKVTPISDFWYITDNYRWELPQWLEENHIDYVLSYYPQLLMIFAKSEFAHKFVWVPPTFNPAHFNDWGLPKSYDVGFIGSGIDQEQGFYPHRWAIAEKLRKATGLRLLFKPHPGWGFHDPEHPYVGKGFSRHINICKMFICTGGKYDLPLARYFETMASKSLLLGMEPRGEKELGLKDGENYVRITPENVLDKIDYYMTHEEERLRIAEAGYRLAMSRHHCYARAMDFYRAIHPQEPTQFDQGPYWANISR